MQEQLFLESLNNKIKRRYYVMLRNLFVALLFVIVFCPLVAVGPNKPTIQPVPSPFPIGLPEIE